jgi:hypothetical protein
MGIDTEFMTDKYITSQGESILVEPQAKRAEKKPDYGQIPKGALEAIAKRFSKGEKVYGRDNWKTGGGDYRRDAANHAYEHLLNYIEYTYNSGQHTQDDDLAAIGWWVCTEIWHNTQEEP